MSTSEEKARVVREGFIRQRRSLIVVSLGLLWYLSAGIRLSTITLLGNSFSIERPALVPAAMWLAWAYFLLRYYQHLRDLDDKDWSSEVATRVNRAIRRYAERRILASLVRQYGAVEDLTVAPISTSETEGKILLKADGSFAVTVEGKRTTEAFVGWTHTVRRSAFRLPTAWAWIHTSMHTRNFTEYALPFLVALGPIAFAIWHSLTKA